MIQEVPGENSEGDTIRLTCAVEIGRPAPELDWLIGSSDGKKFHQLEDTVIKFSISQYNNEVDIKF